MKQILLIATLFYSFTGLFGQNLATDISEIEAEAHKNKLYPKEETSVGQNFDIHYHRMVWEIDPAEYYIKGSVTTYFNYTTTGESTISFDLSSYLDIDSVWFHESKITYTLADDILTLTLPIQTVEYEIDSVTVYYQGAPYQNDFGSFEQDFHNGAPIIWTLSEPYGAKDWWPCKQNLADKIDSVDIFVITPSEYKAASNGVLVSQNTTAKGDIISYWKHRHPIAAYLVAIAVTDYAVYSDYANCDACGKKGSQIEILNYVYPEELNSIQDQTKEIVPIIELFNDLFIPYPFHNEKYGHAQFGWGGGMEHQTMSFMVGFGKFLMAHELGHQWFGDYITCGSWKDIWLNEGFAVYMEGLIVENGLTDIEMRDWLRDEVTTVTSLPGGSVYVDDTTSVYRIFDGRLTYAKGGMALHMLRNQIGDEAFFGAIRNYLQDEKLSNGFAYTPDLQAHFEATSDTDLDYYFQDWIYGQGYPKYAVRWSQNEDGAVNVNLHQTQSHTSVDFFELKVPVKFVDSENDTIIWLDNTQNDQDFAFDLDFQVAQVYFNPNYDIVSKNNTVEHELASIDELGLNIVPSAAKGIYSLVSLNPTQYQKISVYKINGQLVKEYYPDKELFRFDINLQYAETGSYIVVAQINNKLFTKKIFKN